MDKIPPWCSLKFEENRSAHFLLETGHLGKSHLKVLSLTEHHLAIWQWILHLLCEIHLDLLAAIFLSYKYGKQICLQVLITAELRKQKDSSEACRQAKVSFVAFSECISSAKHMQSHCCSKLLGYTSSSSKALCTACVLPQKLREFSVRI